MRENYRKTMVSCYVGFVTQAIVNNLAPLLFLTFQKSYELSLHQITALVLFNFLTQLLVDLLAAGYADRLGYRTCVVSAHVLCAVGLAGLGLFPMLLPPYGGLVLAVVLYAIGGGLLEVLLSPIMEACPTENKEASMSLLHSFYGWGSMAVIAVSTLLFRLFGMEHWPWVACFWAVVPLCNAVSFLTAPIARVVPEGEEMGVRQLLQEKQFWLFVLLMVCAGAAEQAMSQWASAFAESGLQVSKTMGDLAGPCFFAGMLGLSRAIHAKLADRIRLEVYLSGCALLCLIGYLLAVLPIPAWINLSGCGLCGFAVGVMWPGTFSLAARTCCRGGTAMFSFLALAGDLGCTAGPGLVGFVSGLWDDKLKIGLTAAMIFPITIGLVIGRMNGKKREVCQRV